MKKLLRKLIFLGIAAIAVVWLASWGKCESLTAVYGKAFGRLAGDELKVLYYSGEYAEVYSTGEPSELLTYRKRGDEWTVSSRRVVKNAGDKSAKILVWPYFWHYLITE